MPLIWSVGGVQQAYQTHRRDADTVDFEKVLTEESERERKNKSKTPLKKAVGTYEEVKKPSQPHHRPVLAVRDLMSRSVRTLPLNSTLEDARREMELHHFRHLPIVDSKGRAVGMLSDRDLHRAQVGENAKVSEVMSTRVLTATPDTSVREAAGVMLHEKINSLPIVNELGVLQGILTTSDILRGLWNEAPLELWV